MVESKTPQPSPSPSFENSLERLQHAVKKLESGELGLEDALKQFEEGVRLAKECQAILSDAEKRVEILTHGGEGSSPELQPFKNPN